MTDPISVSDDMLRSFFQRWQRLEEEKQTISDDLKELFAEAKGQGFDTKAMRAVFREQVGDKAERQEFDAICDLYRASLSRPHARPAPAQENIEEFPLKAVKNEPAAAADAAGDYLREPMAAASGQIIREGDAPRGTDRQDGDAPSPDTDFEPPTFLTRKHHVLRPHCQNPDMCAGSGRDHCRSCENLHAESEAA